MTHADILCTTCLARLPADDLVLRCPAGCGQAPAGHPLTGHHGRMPLPRPWPSPYGQSWPCPRRGCARVLTAVTPSNCTRLLLRPVGMPDRAVRHGVILALDGAASDAAALGAMAVALCRPGDGPAPPGGSPGFAPLTPATWRLWRGAHLVPDRMPFPDGWEPAVFGRAPARDDDWGLRVHLHSWPAALVAEDRPVPPLDCPNIAASPAAQRLLNADQVVLVASAPAVLDEDARTRTAALAERLAGAFQRAWPGAAGPPGLCLCLVEAEALFACLGTGAARPGELVAAGAADRLAEVVETYVLRSARMADLLAPLLGLPWRRDPRGRAVTCALAGVRDAEGPEGAGMRPWVDALFEEHAP